MPPSLLYVAGKSGGHIIPALTLARAEHEKGAQIFFIAEDRPLDRQLLNKDSWINGAAFLTIPTISRRAWWHYPWYGIQVAYAALRALFALLRWKPKIVVSTGGLVALPVCYAARLLKIPYVLYELNSELGAAVKHLQRGAAEVRCCSTRALSHLHPTTLGKQVSYPLRPQHLRYASATAARVALRLDPYRYTLFIIGGSQGSRALNELIEGWIAQLPSSREDALQIIHQTGAEQSNSARAVYVQKKIPAYIFAYRDDLAACYQAADLVITRAGAGALSELAHFGNRALIIPLITPDTAHQRTNAEELAQNHPQWTVVEQADHTTLYRLLTTIIEQHTLIK